MRITTLFMLVLAFVSLSAHAANIQVLGLFKHRAIVLVDGKQRSLAVGQTSPEGITLVSADSNSAVLEVAGKRASYPLGSRVGGTFSRPKHTTVQLYANAQGMYNAVGSIDGFPVNFLVDTGATLIAMNAQQAKRLGIDYRLRGQAASVNTASGVEQAYQVKLARVRVGDIELRDIDAVVLNGNSPTEVLLGMSFLGRLDIQRSGQVMELRKKH